MAPEQIAGGEVSVRSDIYTLGLVLYEIFTGHRTFNAQTIKEMQNLHTSAAPSSLTHHVVDLDPAVERAVLQCLEKNPDDRPTSALAVSAALPGGDPLAAALAAGETPSPELVAEAGSLKGMAPARALLLAFVGLAMLFGGSYWAGTMSITNFLPLDRRPEVLEDRARTLIAELGYTEDVYAHPTDKAWGLFTWSSVISAVGKNDTTGTPWLGLKSRADAMSFWYRQSPDYLLPRPTGAPTFLRGPVGLSDPAVSKLGEIIVLLDAAGHLRRLEVMPNRFSTADTIVEPDWMSLFIMAGLDSTRFTETRPRYQRFMTPDRRRAWIGSMAIRPNTEIRVEAGSFEGRPVLFNVAASAALKSLGDPPTVIERSTSWYVGWLLQPLLILLVIFVSSRTARHNFKQGRADRRGALRLGSFSFGLFIVASILDSHTMFTWLWVDEIWAIIVGALFMGLASWSMYAAVEPLGRQVWPTMFISSSRLLSRPRLQWLDPILGKSVLIGIIGGSLEFLVRAPVRRLLTPLWSDEFLTPLYINMSLFQGQRHALATVLDQALLLAFMFMFVVTLVLIRKMVHRIPLSLALTLLVWTFLKGPGTMSDIGFNLVSSIIMMVLLLRWGVVTLLISQIVLNLSWQTRATDWTAWYAESAVIILVALTMLTGYGVWAAIGTRREKL